MLNDNDKECGFWPGRGVGRLDLVWLSELPLPLQFLYAGIGVALAAALLALVT